VSASRTSSALWKRKLLLSCQLNRLCRI
jgi:hypothetical protein